MITILVWAKLMPPSALTPSASLCGRLQRPTTFVIITPQKIAALFAPRHLGAVRRGFSFPQHQGRGHHHYLLPLPLWPSRGSPPPSPCSYWCTPPASSSPAPSWACPERTGSPKGCPPSGCHGLFSASFPTHGFISCSHLNP